MTFKTNAYRKLIASTVTTAVVASAFAGTAGAASSADQWNADKEAAFSYYVKAEVLSPLANLDVEVTRADAAKFYAQALNLPVGNTTTEFSDLSESNRANQYVAALVEAGIINGYEDGTFRPERVLTRAEASKILAAAYGLELNAGSAAKFEDVKEWAAPYVGALVDAGLTNGMSAAQYGSEDKLTLAQTAVFAKRAVDAGLKSSAALLTVENVSVVDATTLSVTLSDGTTNNVTLEKNLKDGVATEVTFTINDVEYNEIVTYEAPKLASVVATNGKELVIHFNKVIDAASLKDGSGNDVITVADGEGAASPGTISQSLSEDGKTLTLKANNFFKGDYIVKVPFEIVKDVKGEFVKPINASLNISDTVAPVLSSAKATVKSTEDAITLMTLAFNEEVKSIDNVKVNGSNYPVSVKGNQATIAVNLDGTKTYDVTVVNATDAAGNVKDVQSAPLNVTVDNVPPSITNVEATGENTVKITLDKELKDDALTVSGKVGTFNTDIVTSAVVNPDNKKEYTVTLNSSYLFKGGNTDTVHLTVAKDALVDTLGNANATEIVKTASVAKDVVAPNVTGVENIATDGKVTGFTVTFAEEVTSVDPSKVDVVNAKGEILSLANVVAKAVVSDTDAKKVVFTLKEGVTTDQYGFELREGFVTDASLAKNKSVKHAFVVDVTATSQPEANTFTIANATVENNVITADFGQKVKATSDGSALNPGSYQLNGETLPADTKVEFVTNSGVVDQTKVNITLPEGFVKADDAKAIFRVTGVQTLDHKVNNAYIAEVAVTDNTAPEVTGFVAIDLNKVEITFSEAIATIDPATQQVSDEIKLFDNSGAQVSVTGFEVTAEGKLILTVSDAAAVTKLTTIETVDVADIVDAKGNAQKIGVTMTK